MYHKDPCTKPESLFDKYNITIFYPIVLILACSLSVSTDVDDCAQNPCKHGTCLDQLNDFTCTCESGWEGKQCDQGIISILPAIKARSVIQLSVVNDFNSLL